MLNLATLDWAGGLGGGVEREGGSLGVLIFSSFGEKVNGYLFEVDSLKKLTCPFLEINEIFEILHL